ncbi:MAG: tRNA 2-selenouridine(34) synthase MnmH [Flavobacteriales bacterium]|nr:tRNA 2-selenouridine(34) synthase MnmH [Flavobacteriales bacterium]MCB9193798.1 tRNA 2-selenouridine(34) synthase MnmH [Flavobacteriales bacterium]
MVRPCDVTEFLHGDLPMIDVRSPGEFARGHIPGAHSLPLFSDEERAVVGTLYKQKGREQAVLEGLRIVGPKLAGIVEQARQVAPGGRIAVHCWRGGERSGSVAWLLDKAGFAEVVTLKKGYKAFRHHVLSSFLGPPAFMVVGGYTGSGKTEVLGALRDRGEQVIDLEGLANHRGSSFGALGLPPQPTTEHFENLLWDALHRLDRTRITWIEDESMMIGRVKLPDRIHASIRRSHMLFLEIPAEERARHSVAVYGASDRDALRAATQRIEKRLGPQHCKAALEAIDGGDLVHAARITLTYYDKTYARGVSARDPMRVRRIAHPLVEPDAIARMLMENTLAPHAGQ